MSYHKTALDILTKQRPRAVASDYIIDEYGNSETRMLCTAYAYLIIANDRFAPRDAAANAVFTESWGLNTSLATLNQDVAKCDFDDGYCLKDVALKT